ncbi:MAG TPA: sigma factor-like helix-turn-helix DNA-binding protein [Propionibacteriaceae bacterium]|nr:sigma factor-like helix-turn-helix DNA-binding protein [Propionibacteriaceae bacterium]
MQRAGRGDAGAFADLYDETSTLVYGMALSILQSPSLAARLTPVIYAEVWQQAPRHEQSQGTLAWLLSIAHRHLVEQVRALSKDSAPQRYAVLNGDSRFDHLRQESGRSNSDRTRIAWGSLPPIHRDAVALAYFGGYSQTDVARILGVPLGTVKARIRDGLAALRAAMGEGS